jgi:iron complex transport system substrate-binding protein
VKKIKRFLVMILVLLFSAGACSRGSGPHGPRGSRPPPAGSAAETQGGFPRRIISAAPSNTEIITGLGLGGSLAAVDKYSPVPPEAPDSLLLIDFASPDTEALLRLRPDMIIASEYNKGLTGEAPFRILEEGGIPVIYIPTSRNIEEIFETIRMIAGALGKEEEGERLVAEMKRDIEDVAAVGRTIKEKRRVYFEVSPFPSFVSFGAGTYLDDMITLLGGVNIFAGEKSWFSPGAESIIRGNPDVILTLSGMNGDTPEGIRGRPGFDTLNAVIHDRIYTIDADSAARPSQHVVKALKEMAAKIYPEYYGLYEPEQ